MQLQTAVHNRSPGKLALLTECSDGERAPDHRESFAGFMDRVGVGPLRNRTSGIVLSRLALDRAHGPHLGGNSQSICAVSIAHGDGADARRVLVDLGARHAAFEIPAGGAATVEIDTTPHTTPHTHT